MRAFILAGGFATRLWPLTEKRAKPLLPLAGKPLLTHLVEKLPLDLPVTVSTNAEFEEGFREWQKTIQGRNMDLIIEGTRKDDHKLGALGAISAWVQEKKIDDDLLILTGDNHLGFAMEDFLRSFTGDPLLAAHDIGDLARASAFGTVITRAGDERIVEKFEEKPKDPKTTLVSAGCAILPRSTLLVLIDYAKVHPDNVGGIFEEFLRQGITVTCFRFTEPWMDIGSFHSYLDAHRTLVGNQVLLDPTAVMELSETEGGIAIGAGSTVRRSILKDCMVFERCTIENCTLRDCVIDSDCVLRNVDLHHQMLRSGTRLEVKS